MIIIHYSCGIGIVVAADLTVTNASRLMVNEEHDLGKVWWD